MPFHPAMLRLCECVWTAPCRVNHCPRIHFTTVAVYLNVALWLHKHTYTQTAEVSTPRDHTWHYGPCFWLMKIAVPSLITQDGLLLSNPPTPYSSLMVGVRAAVETPNRDKKMMRSDNKEEALEVNMSVWKKGNHLTSTTHLIYRTNLCREAGWNQAVYSGSYLPVAAVQQVKR